MPDNGFNHASGLACPRKSGRISQNPCTAIGEIYRLLESTPSSPENFELPFEGQLSLDNRWVIMASLVPWSEFEGEYSKNFAEEMGAPALPLDLSNK